MTSMAFSLFLLMHLRFYKRPAGRPWIFDAGLIYFATYGILGSNIPGVFYTWHEYEHLALKMVKSARIKKGTI